MTKNIIFTIFTAFILIFYGCAFAGDTHSGQAAAESAKAGSHVSKSVAHAIMGTGQVVSAASAVPLAISGAVGGVSAELAKDLMDAATRPIGEPLEITDETVSVDPPPDQVLKIDKE
ncbi:MAG: hypothetical protein JRJ44_05265 [Deltaproteobacteria bacterium]|nr:hypothetical protein [Deltaproteobacteria bacterium]